MVASPFHLEEIFLLVLWRKENPQLYNWSSFGSFVVPGLHYITFLNIPGSKTTTEMSWQKDFLGSSVHVEEWHVAPTNPTSSTCGHSCCPHHPFHHILANYGLTNDTEVVLFPSQIEVHPKCSLSWWLLTATAYCSCCVFCNLDTERLPELNRWCFEGLLCWRHHGCRTCGLLAWISHLLQWLIGGSVDGCESISLTPFWI